MSIWRSSPARKCLGSERFPFIVGGLGVGPVYASHASCRWNCRVNCRENCRVNCRGNCRRDCRRNSVPIGKVAKGVLMWCLWLSSGVAVSMGEAAKRVVFDGVKVSKLEEVSYQMLVLRLPHVSSSVSVAFLWHRTVYGGSCKTRRSWRCQSVKLEEVLYEMFVLTLPHVSSTVSVAFLWHRTVYGGSCKTRRFWRCQSVKIGGSLVRNVRFDAPTCLLFCFCGFPLASHCLWGKLQNASFLKVSKCQNWRKSCTKCSFWRSHVSCWASTLPTPHFTLHTPHSTPHFPLHTTPSTLYTSPGATASEVGGAVPTFLIMYEHNGGGGVVHFWPKMYEH